MRYLKVLLWLCTVKFNLNLVEHFGIGIDFKLDLLYHSIIGLQSKLLLILKLLNFKLFDLLYLNAVLLFLLDISL